MAINLIQREIITFPRVVHGNVLGGVEHTFNSINAGMVPISKMNLLDNFYGGNCKYFGLISEYGFYACPHYESQRIMGFYIYDPDMVTERGWKLIEQRFPDCDISHEKVTTVTNRNMTKTEYEEKVAKLEKVKQFGASPALAQGATMEELDGLLKALESGKAKTVVQQEPAVASETPVTVRRGKPREDD